MMYFFAQPIRFAENFIALQMLEMVLKNGRESDVLAFELWVE